MKLIQMLITNLFSFSLVAATIQVGPNKPVKDLSKIADGNEYVLDAGSYSVPDLTIKKSLSIHSADPKNPASISVKTSYTNVPSKDNNGKPITKAVANPSIKCYGACQMHDVNIKGSEDMVIFVTYPGATLLAQDILMDNGAIWIGSGGQDIKIIRVQSTGRSHAYFIANFSNAVQNLLVDETGNKYPIYQGGHCTNGKPTCDQNHLFGEAAVRIMDTVNGKLIGLDIRPWLFDGQHEWKQTLQLRHSDTIEVVNSKVHSLDLGNMTWENISKIEAAGGKMIEMKKVILTDDQVGSINMHAGLRELVVQKTVNGKITVVSDKKYGFTCPSDPNKGCTLK